MANLTFLKSLLVLFLSTYYVLALQPVDVKVNFDSQTSPDFKILISGVEWLRSGTVSIRDKGLTWATSNSEKNILKPIGRTEVTGEDIIGEFDTVT